MIDKWWDVFGCIATGRFDGYTQGFLLVPLVIRLLDGD
jgi:hypothetical protein